MELAEILTRILEEAFPGGRVEDLEEAPAGARIGGVLVWEGFDGMEPIDRQAELWRVLREKLSAEQQQQVSLIMAFTPRELEAISAD